MSSLAPARAALSSSCSAKNSPPSPSAATVICVRLGGRGPDRAGQAEPDRLEAVHEDPVPRVLDVEEHRGPAHEVPGVDRDGLARRQQVGERDREVARVDVAVRGGRLVGLVAPAAGGELRAHLVGAVAGRPVSAGGELGLHRLRHRAGVADDGEVDPAVRADRARLDVDLHDARLRADELAVARGPVVERRAEREDDVGLRQQLGGDRRGEPARDAQRPRIAVEDPLRHRAVGQQRAGTLAEGGERGPGAAEHGATAGDDDRPLRALQQVGDGGDLLRARRGRRRHGQHARLGRVDGGLRLQVDRQVEHDGAALERGAAVRARGVRLGGGRAVDRLGDRADRVGEVVLVDAEVRGERGAGRVPGDDEHRRPRLRRLGEAGHGVREARPLVHGAHADASRDARPAVGHAQRAGLVAGGEEPRAAALERLGGDEVAAADDAEDGLHAERREPAADGGGNGLRRALVSPGGAHRLLCIANGGQWITGPLRDMLHGTEMTCRVRP